MSLRLGAAAGLVVALLAPPALAHASTARVEDGVLLLEGDEAVNHLHLDSPAQGEAQVSDRAPGATLTTGPGCDEGRCRGFRRVVVTLGGGDDQHSDLGLTAPISVTAGDGADVVFTTSSRIRLFGGPGNDRMRADTVSSTSLLSGEDGEDELQVIHGGRISGGRDDDRLIGAVVIRGGPGRDLLDGGVGVNRLFGDAGDDTLDPGSGRDIANGGSGNDRISARDRRRDRVDCGPGRDRVSRDRRDRVRRCERR